MAIQISDRMRDMTPSAIREILKTNTPISFSAGNPSPETFPAKELGLLAAEIFEKEFATALQYGLTEGYGPLRELTKSRMRDKYGIGGEDDELIIVSGGAQGIDLAAKCLLNEGDVVICENPSYVGALLDYRSHRARLVGVDMDAHGMDMEALARVLQVEKRAKVIYTIPTFQNPMGVTMPLERRKRLVELAVKYDVMILEDSPYFELRYEGAPVPCVKSLDTTGHVLFSGSFSKVVAPGLRTGYVCGPKALISKMVVAKQGQDVHTNLLSMMLIARFLERYDLDAHIARCCALYREKRDRMLKNLETHVDARVSFTRPEGGLFLWGQLPEGFTGTEFSRAAADRGVAVVPGMAFDVAENPENRGFRVNFSLPALEQIDAGTVILGETFARLANSRD